MRRTAQGLATMIAALIALGAVTSGCARERTLQDEAALMECRKKFLVDYDAARGELFERLIARLRYKHDAYVAGQGPAPTLDILVLSGGGDYGAFGSGFLKGWGSVTDPELKRPEFDVVLGVSTGALIAPFAYLGGEADYDQVLELYKNPKKDWVKDRGLLFFLPANESFAEVPGLERDLRAAVPKERIDQIAAEGRKGRLLMVNTTDLDFGLSRVWDLSHESQRAVEKGEYERVYQMMLASAGIPAAFPSREIDGGLYVDGGVTANIIYGGALKADKGFQAEWVRRQPGIPPPRMRYWVIINNQVCTPPKTVHPQWPAVIGRSVETAIRSSTITSLRHLATMVELMKLRDNANVELRIIAIPDEWRAPKPGVFIRETMADLSDLGERMGADPGSWLKECP